MKHSAMLKQPRPGAAATLAKRAQLARMVQASALLPLLLCGCRLPPLAPPPRPGTPKPVFSVNMPLDALTNDPDAKAILYRDVPGVMNNPKYPLFEDMSLTQIAILADGKLPKEKLDEVQADFDKLSAK